MKNIALNQIIGDISHDIQSKITSIKAQVYLAKHQRGDLQKVETELQQLSYLFDDLATLLIFYESKTQFDFTTLKFEKLISPLADEFLFDMQIDNKISADVGIKTNQDLLNWFLKIFKKYLLLKNFEKKGIVAVEKNGQKIEIKYQFVPRDDQKEQKNNSKLLTFYLFSLQSVADLLNFNFVVNENDSYSLIV